MQEQLNRSFYLLLFKFLSFVQSCQLYAQYSGLYLIFSALSCFVLFFLMFSPFDEAEQHDKQAEQEPEPYDDSGKRSTADKRFAARFLARFIRFALKLVARCLTLK
ncbi:Hypothetical_protein [Hexamita inflata]|uniref:Hypothetical_protein n=1 Tax=Hexamita inflata TaxID=28002 RepID=A0AA86N865_9EUKA|nr:Hypothetical protein HINF_LOCUS2183 [Hexamita inflata]